MRMWLTETFFFFLVQVSTCSSFHSKIVKAVKDCLLRSVTIRKNVLVCSGVIRCFEVCKFLLFGDVELNPGHKSHQAQELVEMPQLP